MDILELAIQLGLSFKRVSSTHGGEYVGPCPYCQEGVDRFHIWPNRENKKGIKGAYWCRKCGKSGDLIQFCRDFLGLGYREACLRVGTEPDMCFIRRTTTFSYQPKVSEPPPSLWRQKAKEFVERCHENLLAGPQVLKEIVENRGLRKETIIQFQIGWHPATTFISRRDWGLGEEIGSEHNSMRLSKGIVIPTLIDGVPVKIKIRRSEWWSGDRLPKYDEIPGSQQTLAIIGYGPQKPILVVEAEPDAMLIYQEAGDLCACLPLGGASKRPDFITHDRLHKASLLLVALDFDEAGKGAFAKFWKKTYPQCEPWPICEAKSPGDAFNNGVNLRTWVEEGLRRHHWMSAVAGSIVEPERI